jgi:hypothetical protein
MPPKKIRVIPRSSTPADSVSPVVSPAANARPASTIQRPRQRIGYLDATELAEILNYADVKRVYALDIRRFPLGGGGKRGLRWDPNDVAEYLESRLRDDDKAAA